MIGRIEEIKRLKAAYASEQSEFVTIYGRRRIGKTFLVNETFGYKFAFHHAGLKRQGLKEQLEQFRFSLMRQGYAQCPVFRSWLEAFYHLEVFLEKRPRGRKVVFLDEMPWMDTFKSGFLSALEGFWNGWATSRKDILLVACGSATSWIVKKLHRNTGGLHNRVTTKIKLYPFTLNECEQYAAERHLGFNRRQLAECYMAFGGVAYYWSQLERGKSVEQNFDALFFGEQDGLREEFDELYQSLFNSPEPYVKIVMALGKRRLGLDRGELMTVLGTGSGGNLSKHLDELEECGFVRKYNLPGRNTKGAIWQLIDSYTLFYFQFVRGAKAREGDYWSERVSQSEKSAWRGLAFERLCLEHVRQMKRALGISGVATTVYAWHEKGDANRRGAQIDLLIDRKDDIVNVCEMKYASSLYSIDKDESARLRNRIERFRECTGTTKSLHLTLVTVEGLVENNYRWDVQSVITLDDLFAF